MAKKCRYCKGEFLPFKSTQIVCSPACAVDLAKLKREQKEKADWNKEKKSLKESLKTKQDYEKDLEKVFNEFIRLRDKDLPCISCNAYQGSYRITAGHFYPAGSYKNLRFNEDNVHGQCWFNCNKNRHGNLHEYRKGLEIRIGQERLDELDRLAQIPAHFSIPEIKEMIKIYKKKVRELKNNL